MSNRKPVYAFLAGLTLSFLFVYLTILGGLSIAENPDGSYRYVNRKYYSDLNDTQVFDLGNFTISLKAMTYWKSKDDISRPMSALSSIPYAFNLSIRNNVDTVQWLQVSEIFSSVELYQDSELLNRLIAFNDTINTKGVFLAPNGRHELVMWWKGKSYNEYLSDGVYVLRFSTLIDGAEYFVLAPFSVETRLVKEKTNLVTLI